MTRAYLGLGSNLGDRLGHLAGCVEALSSRQGMEVTAVSGVYSSEPVGVTDQPEFLNAVVEVETDLEPVELLAAAMSIEGERERRGGVRWGPRTADIDILLYGDEVIDLPELAIPHPRLCERRFALEPLLEVRPDAHLPDGTPLARVLAGLPGRPWVRREKESIHR